MNLFHIVDDCRVITRFRGVFRQVEVYRRGDNLYARHGSGFVKLMGHPNTTAPGVSWDEIEPHDQIVEANVKWKQPKWRT